jgi:hypothetical protein
MNKVIIDFRNKLIYKKDSYVMYKSIVIIGLGSLGGFFAENISRMDGLQTLILIDPDIIEHRNIGRSIYRKSDIGKFKVIALKEIIKHNNEDLNIITHPIEYIDNRVVTPNADLVIDCRDIVCTRDCNIDVRLYISYTTLVIDTKKNIKVNKKSNGRYIHGLRNLDLAAASIIATQIIYSGEIKELIRKQLIQQIPINSANKEILKSIRDYDDKPDIVIDYCKGDEKIRNFYECLPSIVRANTTRDMILIVGQDKNGQVIQKFKKCEITSFNNAVTKIGELTRNLNLNYESYTLKLNEIDHDEVYIELLPETGGA